MSATDLNDGIFLTELTKELVKNLPNWYGSDNWDSDVLPYRETSGDWFFANIRKIFKFIFKDSVLIKNSDFETLVVSLSKSENSLLELSRLYDLLQDSHSRSILVSLIAYRLMGYRKVKLPINTASYWEIRKTAQSSIKKLERTLKIGFRDWSLNHMDLTNLGYPIESYLMPVWAVATFGLKQYEYCRENIAIKAQLGDYVIDAGGGWGDTALYFSHNVGAQGRVYTFEFSPDNLEVFHQNLELNPGLATNIQIIQNALWDKSHELLEFSSNGPATSLKNNQNHQGSYFHVTTLSLDDFVRDTGITRVDFIKMDVEGAELKALIGAEKTIRRFKPKLAISVYHNPDDFVDISNYLDGLKVGYEFFLDHFTIYRAETILFACAKTK